MTFAHLYPYEGSYICEFCGDDVGTERDGEIHQLEDCLDFAPLKLAAIEKFWQHVCARAEANRPNTAKTERYSGAHYHAAVVLIAEMRMGAAGNTIPDPFDADEYRLWTCSDEGCGACPDVHDSRWRWNGSRWQHHHGYPIGHVDAVRRVAE